jgi:hypothetical protein
MRVVANARVAAAALHRLTALALLLPRGTKLDLERLSVLILQIAGAVSRPWLLCTHSSTAQARGARMLHLLCVSQNVEFKYL